VFSNYNYVIQSFLSDNEFKATSQITDVNLKEDLSYSMGDNHTLKFGLNILHHNISPGDITASASSSFNNVKVMLDLNSSASNREHSAYHRISDF